MAIDGPVRTELTQGEGKLPPRQAGYLAGSKAMESLDKFVTSTESFFHPSNSGIWSLSVRQLLYSLVCSLISLSIVDPVPPLFDI
jgi:proteasome activator subunit 4